MAAIFHGVLHKDMFSFSTTPSTKSSYSATSIQLVSACDDSIPVNKGGFIDIKIDQKVYDQQIAMCQNALIARIILSKGESPWKLIDLKKKLTDIWRITSNWKLISLGRGYYHVILNSISEKNSVWSNGVIMLKPGILRLQHWSPDFDPSSQKSTNTQAWVRLYKLSWEYWHPKILSSIAKGIGVPLKIDNATNAAEFGYYARVLIDVDLSSTVPEKSSYRKGRQNCSNIGHHPRDCRLNKKLDQHVSIDKPAVQEKIWKQRHQKNEDIPIDNVFKHLRNDLAFEVAQVNSVLEPYKETPIENAENVSVIEHQNKAGKPSTDDTSIEISNEISAHVGTLFPQRWENLVDSDSSKDTSNNINANSEKCFETVGFQNWSNNIQEEQEYWTMVQRKNKTHQKKFSKKSDFSTPAFY
ncbi:uncharacterized protein LOC126661935 [Mercurialis annua]|uniref:uncharacterized protein LOC126661935 n=1 Tax=Mercurialis annua TaxID=3986 RepID=UPI002160E179|nr:uncharacterized protein LOC126661935 [Mercurialis annua]